MIYLLLIRHSKNTYYRDPTSYFFDPVRGYQRYYSLVRQQQAEAFIEASSHKPSTNTPHKTIAPKLCIGIATIARENEQYVQATIGSLLEGLTPDERGEIYLAVLIAHTDPTTHPITNESWLTALTDKVLHYDVSPEQKHELETWEREKDFRRKAIFDYTYVMQKCADTHAQWVAMIEDDTLAVTHWYPRAMAALEQADDGYRVTTGPSPPSVAGQGEDQIAKGPTTTITTTTDWLYLRMFYTEEFLGWNVEEWPLYLFASTAVVLATAFALLLLRKAFSSRGSSSNTIITNTSIATTSLICVPLLITLYFLSGRQSMAPTPPYGVSEMPKFGCCAQGLIFSSNMTPQIITRLREAGSGFVDQLIEAWANELGMVRWVVAPSLLQHVGAHSSKGDDLGDGAKWDRSVAEKIWNFAFERYDDRYF